MFRPSIVSTAVSAVAAAALLAAWGTFGQAGETHATREYLVVLAIIGVATLAIFGWVVPRALRSTAAGWTSVVLACLALATVAAFWSGLPPVLGAGAAVVGWAQRDLRRGKIALAIGTLALVADVVVYIGDATGWF
jgi:hypothetical protein